MMYQPPIVSRMHEAAKVGAVSMVTDMWSDNVVQNNYLEITFFWVSDNNDEWSLKHRMYECKYFPEKKTNFVCSIHEYNFILCFLG